MEEFHYTKAPTPDKIKEEWMETTGAMLVTSTMADWIEERRRANMLLDLYIDLGYLAGHDVVLLERAPPQGYEQIES